MATPLAHGARKWGLITLAVTGIGLLNFFVVVTSRLAEGSRPSAKEPFVWEMTGAYSFLLVLPALLRFLRRFPLTRETLPARLPLHAAAFVAWGATLTLLMWGSRTVLYRLLGWGTYDYGDMRWRFLMEGGKQLVAWCGVYAVVAAVDAARRMRERERTAARLEQQLTEARLTALKMQLNPHFLFNTLNMIAAHVHDDPRTAEAMIGHLSDFLRLTLRHSREQELSLDEELRLLESYLAVMKARFEERLSVTLDVAAEARGAMVPHLVLQPLVENAVTHAMDDPARPGMLRIAAAREGNALRLAIEDNGPGLAGDVEDALGRGLGLSSTVERLRHLYGEAQGVEIVNRPEGGLRVALTVPFRTAAGTA